MSGLYPANFLTWVALTGDKSPASIALRVIETHKPHNRDKVAPAGELDEDEDYFGFSHISDLKIGTPVAILPDPWRNRFSAGTGWPAISIL